MNDAEIIKGIETCADDKIKCEVCPYFNKKSPECVGTMCKDALDLIKRQQAEINHFVDLNKMVCETKTVQTDDKEFIKMLVNQRVTFIPKSDDIKAIQRDAVVNFAERLKPLYKTLCVDEGDWCYEIDNLVNEMFGNPEQVKGETNI